MWCEDFSQLLHCLVHKLVFSPVLGWPKNRPQRQEDRNLCCIPCSWILLRCIQCVDHGTCVESEDNFLEWVLALLVEAQPPSLLLQLVGWAKSFQAILSLPPILLEVCWLLALKPSTVIQKLFTARF